MADKFPELEDSQIPNEELEEDFLTREKAILGDDANQFVTEQDNEILEQEEDEVKKFEQLFPNVEDKTNQLQQEDEEENLDEPIFNPPKSESDAVKEWKERYQLEITKRDEEDEKKTKEIREAAEKQLDDFYEDYNTKKEENIQKAKNAEAEFLSKRDEFYTKGDVWSRSLELLKDDKTNKRFKELLEAKIKTTQN